MRILICTDGTPIAENAVRFAAPLARATGAEVTLLGIAASAQAETRVRQGLAYAQSLLPARAEEKIRLGQPTEEILAEVNRGDYALLVVGSRGRRGVARWLLGSVAPRLARYARVPVLIVKGQRTQIRRILLCTGGEAPGERVARLGGQLLRGLNAEIAVLHVMSQIALSPRAKLDDLFDTAEQALADGTREGQHLAREMELLREQGVTTLVQPRLRHGLVLDEIVGEARAGDYDLVVIGAHAAPDIPQGWGWLKEYLLDDVADQVISALDQPVLVVKSGG